MRYVPFRPAPASSHATCSARHTPLRSRIAGDPSGRTAVASRSGRRGQHRDGDRARLSVEAAVGRLSRGRLRALLHSLGRGGHARDAAACDRMGGRVPGVGIDHRPPGDRTTGRDRDCVLHPHFRRGRPLVGRPPVSACAALRCGDLLFRTCVGSSVAVARAASARRNLRHGRVVGHARACPRARYDTNRVLDLRHRLASDQRRSVHRAALCLVLPDSPARSDGARAARSTRPIPRGSRSRCWS